MRSDWFFLAGIVDADAGALISIGKSVPAAVNYRGSLDPSHALILPNSFRDRPMDGGNWDILGSTRASGVVGMAVELAACAVWSRALSENEMQAQYEKMQKIMADRGIAI